MATGIDFPSSDNAAGLDPSRAYTVLMCHVIGLKIGADGQPVALEAEAYIEERGRLPSWRYRRFSAAELGTIFQQHAPAA